MPTRFWVKKTGNPSSKIIAIATTKNIGEIINTKIRASSLLIIIVKCIMNTKLMKFSQAKT